MDGPYSSIFKFCNKWPVIRDNVGSFFFSLYWHVTLSVKPPQSAVPHRLMSVNTTDVSFVSSESHSATRFSSASSAQSSELLLFKHLQHILRLPASLRSVRSLRGFTLCLQIQRTNTVSQSHESRLHGGLEAFRTTLCPICLQTPERIKQRTVNDFICWCVK